MRVQHGNGLNTQFVTAPRLKRISVAIVLAFSLADFAFALPVGEQIISGQIQLVRSNPQNLLVKQGSAKAIVNWQGFSIAPGEAVQFQQPDAGSVILNRVTGSSPSEIFGRLSANGQVFLVNPAGVLFGSTATVDVGSLVASTLRIRDDDFLAGRHVFSADGATGNVNNQGVLNAADRGTIALLGAQVSNGGTISAKLGTVGLAAGGKISLDFNGDGLTKIVVDTATVNALVANGGMIIADGGLAILSARAAGALTETVLNQQGIVRANGLVERNGKIVLDGGDSGVTLVSGTLDASGPHAGLTGGEINVLGHNVGIVDQAQIDTRGDAGGGTVLIGGDYQGKNPLIRNAAATFAGPDTVIRADAVNRGTGGKVIVLSDNATRAYGTISAKGGVQGGDGGFIETSGKYLDVAGVRVDASASNGKAGEWLLDPNDITICSSHCPDVASSPIISGRPNFTSTDDNATLSPATIVDALNTGTTISVATAEAGSNTQTGTITVADSIPYQGVRDASLTLKAQKNITLYPGMEISSSSVDNIQSGRLDVTLLSDSHGPNGGGIVMDSNASIKTNGGNVLFSGGGNTDPIKGFASGVHLGDGSVINTIGQSGTGGNVTIRSKVIGVQDSAAIEFFGVKIQASTGNVSLFGISAGDNLTANTGVHIFNSFTDCSSGDCGTKVVAPSIISTTTGNIAISGMVTNTTHSANGVKIADASSIETIAGGNIDIRGHSESSNTDNIGVFVDGVHNVFVDDTVHVATKGARGNITVIGETTGNGNGILLSGSTQLGGVGTTGDIALHARSENNANALVFGSGTLVTTKGTINILPGGVGFFQLRNNGEFIVEPNFQPSIGIQLGSAAPNADIFQLSQRNLDALHASDVVIGSNGHRGVITVADDIHSVNNLTLQNDALGSGGIHINGALSSLGTITLSSGGIVDQSAPITAARLLLHGSQSKSNFQLSNAGNSVGQFAAQFDTAKENNNYGNVNFTNSGTLAIAPIIGTGFNADTNQPTSINAANTVVAGDLLVNATGNLTLKQNIATLGSDITLATGGVFINAASGALLPGGAGKWSVFADTWTGESRSGLIPSSPQPNYYNCTFGGACGVSPGNHFIYRQQPTLIFSADNQTRLYGNPNPVLTFTPAGLLNGDTLTDAVTGGYVTNATQASNVGAYAITGNFASPVGYAINALPATLTVDKAVLTYVADSASRLQGTPNPRLHGKVSGFVLGETQDGVTTGTLNFSSPASPLSSPGKYAINGSGLSAANYIFVQLPANETALAVMPTTLGVTPSILKDVTFESSNLYEKNFGSPRLCVGTGPLSSDSASSAKNDLLSLEWSRVRQSPNLSNCIGLGQRNSCQDF